MLRLVLFIGFLLPEFVFAQFNEVALGAFRQSTAQMVSNGERTSIRPGFGFGVKTESFPCGDFSLKVGLMFEQRTVTAIFSGVEHNPEMKNLDLLTHASYKFSDWFSIFAGPQFTVVLSQDCKPTAGTCLIGQDATKYFIPVQAGLDFTFQQRYGAEIFYESISQEFWEKTFEKSQSYGLNLKYKF